MGAGWPWSCLFEALVAQETGQSDTAQYMCMEVVLEGECREPQEQGPMQPGLASRSGELVKEEVSSGCPGRGEEPCFLKEE